MIDLAQNFTADVTIKSPMGPVKALVAINWQDASHFSGDARLMGFSNTFEGGVRTEDKFAFEITVKVPFGTLDIHIDVSIDPEGQITGEATMPHRKPMAITGRVNG